MRKTVFLGMAVFVALAMLAPPALAQQPPAPKVTINGLVDNVVTWNHNMSIVDLAVSRNRDDEMYARTRVRPDITAEVGSTKFVLGLEIDAVWGQVAGTDSTFSAGANPGQRFGTTHGWDLNTDVQAGIEIKWAYTEFDVPFLPKGSRMRLGAQPFGALCTYKLAAYCNGDFAGAVLTAVVNPQVKLNLGWVNVEEESTGSRDGFTRGDDYAIVVSADVTPFKGLDIKPMYSFFRAEGTTSGAARQGRGGISTAAFVASDSETRHTIGVDARWAMGPIRIEPTVLYQFGERESLGRSADRSAWFLDVRGGWSAGPLLLEGAVIFTTGNKATDDIANGKIRYYEPLSADTSYYATWAEIWALGIDYLQILNGGAGGLNPGVAIGYDRYGLIRVGARATYALTPAFSVRAGLTANWTHRKVDTDGTIAAASGLTPSTGATAGGDDSYLGTELNLGFTWRFAPNVAFDMVGAYMFAGDALGSATAAGRPNRDPEDVQTVVARVRYTF
jgi:hypothetical protein